MSICAGWRRHWSMCSHLVHLVETLVLTIDNMQLDLLWSSSFVPSWHRAVQLSYSPVVRSWMVMTSPSICHRRWRGWSHSEFESSFTLVFMMWTYSRNGRWMSTFPLSSAPLFGVLWWDFWEVRYWWRGSDVSGTRWRDMEALRRCCVPPSTHIPASSTTTSVPMASNLMLKCCKDLSLRE
jgi:hypothetical protein